MLAIIGLIACALFAIRRWVMNMYKKLMLLEQMLSQQQAINDAQAAAVPPAATATTTTEPDELEFELMNISGLRVLIQQYQLMTIAQLRNELKERNLERHHGMLKLELCQLAAMDELVSKRRKPIVIDSGSSAHQPQAVPRPAAMPAPQPIPSMPSRVVPPSSAQIRFAQILSRKPGATLLSQETLDDVVSCSWYIENNKHLMPPR